MTYKLSCVPTVFQNRRGSRSFPISFKIQFLVPADPSFLVPVPETFKNSIENRSLVEELFREATFSGFLLLQRLLDDP